MVSTKNPFMEVLDAKGGDCVAFPNLSAELARNGLTQADLAKAVGRTPETVSRWMNGKGSFPLDLAFKVEKLFPGLTVDYLFAEAPIQTL